MAIPVVLGSSACPANREIDVSHVSGSGLRHEVRRRPRQHRRAGGSGTGHVADDRRTRSRVHSMISERARALVKFGWKRKVSAERNGHVVSRCLVFACAMVISLGASAGPAQTLPANGSLRSRPPWIRKLGDARAQGVIVFVHGVLGLGGSKENASGVFRSRSRESKMEIPVYKSLTG